MSRHLLLPILLLVTLLGSQPCQATVEKEGGHHQQGLGPVQEHDDSGGVHHGHLKDVGGGGGGHNGVADGAGVHSEAGHHGEVRKYWTVTTSLRCIAKFASVNTSLSDPDLEFVNGSSNSSSAVFETHILR